MARRWQLLLGVGLGVLAVIFINFYLQSLKKSLYQGMEFSDVIVASQDLTAGTIITDKNLEVTPYPKKYIHPNTMYSRDMKLILGQRILGDVSKGQPILITDVGGELKPGGEFATTIRKDDRAVTLIVDEATSLSGLIRPNDHVDILVTLRERTREGTGMTTITLLQNVTVIAVGAAFGRAGSGQGRMAYNTVTVSVSPEEAEILVFVQEQGKISLALRNPENLETELDLPKISMDDIIKKDTLTNIQRNRNKRIEIIKGTGAK